MKNTKSQKSLQLNVFKSLSDIFLSDRDKQKKEIEQKVDQLIAGSFFEILTEYRCSGYVMSEKQHDNLIEKVLELHPGAVMKKLNSDIVKGIQLTDNELLKYFNAYCGSQHIQEMSGEKLNEDGQLANGTSKVLEIATVYKKKLKDPTFTYALMQIWDKKFNNYMTHKLIPTTKKFKLGKYNYDSIDNSYVTEHLIIPMARHHIKILSHKSVSELNKIKSQVTSVRKKANKIGGGFSDNYHVGRAMAQLLGKVEEVIKYSFEKDLAVTKQNIELIYVDNHMDELIIKESMKMIERTNTKDLPKVASDLLFDMKENYIALYKKINSLNPEEQFILENLWEKRVPEIISKYLHIDKEDRLTMFNRNNQNAEQLMIESLENINSNFISMKANKNEEGLSSLSVTHKYTKNFKKFN